jgi:hypothetical protein
MEAIFATRSWYPKFKQKNEPMQFEQPIWNSLDQDCNESMG